MISLKQTGQPGQAGFTLVELAIVLVIVGLLIGGILKGQELISATRVNATVSQLKAIDTASNTFLDTYGGLPGDLNAPATRITGCGALPCSGGTAGATLGNSRIDITPEVAITMAGATLAATEVSEGVMFFNQLLRADLISGFVGGNTNVVNTGALMGATIGQNNHYRLGYAAATTDMDGNQMATFQAGHYLALTNIVPGTAIGTTPTGLDPKQAENIDRKSDDSRPTTGSVIAVSGAAGATTCVSAAGGYNTALTTSVCSLYIRSIQ